MNKVVKSTNSLHCTAVINFYTCSHIWLLDIIVRLAGQVLSSPFYRVIDDSLRDPQQVGLWLESIAPDSLLIEAWNECWDFSDDGSPILETILARDLLTGRSLPTLPVCALTFLSHGILSSYQISHGQGEMRLHYFPSVLSNTSELGSLPSTPIINKYILT